MSNPKYSAKIKKVKKIPMVEIKVGKETLLFTVGEAYAFSEVIADVAGQPEFESHVDNIFENWGSDGGTC